MTVADVSAPPSRIQPARVQRSHVGRDRIAVSGLVLLAFALRAPNLDRAYWVDEAISIGISSHHFSQIPSLLREDGSPPLFYYLLHFWLEWFGSAEWVTHLLPLTISLVAIPVAYWAGSQIFSDRRAGLAAAALMATSPFLNWYATETRMYTLVVVVSMVALTFAWRATRDRRAVDAVRAVVAFAVLLYTHNWGIYLAGITVVALLCLAWYHRDRQLALWSIGGGAGVLALWAPWLPSFIYQAKNTAAPWAVGPQITDFFADPSTAIGGTLGILIAPLLVFGSWWCWRNLTSPTQQASRTLALIGLGTTVAGWIGAQIDPSWAVRYLAVIVAPYLLAASGALATTRTGRAMLTAGCAALVIWSVVGTLLPNSNSRYAKSNVAAVAAVVKPYLRPGDLVIVTQTEQVPDLYHYLPKGLDYLTPAGPVSDPEVVNWRGIVGRLQKATPCADLVPALQALPVGAVVLEVNPVRSLGASGSAWSRAVNGQVMKVDTFLAADRSLSYEGLYSPALKPKPYSPVDGVIYRKTAAQLACT